MKIYFAVAATDLKGKSAEFMKRRLFSYAYNKTSDNAATQAVIESSEMGCDIFLDSGAYTAFQLGKAIKCEDYAEFIKFSTDKQGLKWNVISSLDAIGKGEEAAKQSYDNLKTLERLGVRTAPVYHVHEPEHWLQRYVAEGYQYILIGGMVTESTQVLLPRLDYLWSKYLTHKDGTPKVKLHGFGLTTESVMFRYPWFSVDSSSWKLYAAYGHCAFRVGDRIRTIQTSPKSSARRKINSYHIDNLPHVMRVEIERWLQAHKLTVEDVKEDQGRRAVNIITYSELEQYAVKAFKQEQEYLFN